MAFSPVTFLDSDAAVVRCAHNTCQHLNTNKGQRGKQHGEDEQHLKEVGFECDAGGRLGGSTAGDLGAQALLVPLDRGLQATLEVRRRRHQRPEWREELVQPHLQCVHKNHHVCRRLS